MTAIFDWNRSDGEAWRPLGEVAVLDETLRDGIQSPSAYDPCLSDKLELLRLMEALGLDGADIGLPAAGVRAAEDALAMARHVAQRGMHLHLACAARTHGPDIEAVIRVSQEAGVAVEVMAFMAISRLRWLAEGWDRHTLSQGVTQAVRLARQADLRCTIVAEDATRSHPEDLEALIGYATSEGAERICLADTVGQATPQGTRAIVAFARGVIERLGVRAGLDWHGHNDRGLALANTLAALEAGVTRVHGTALGMGERVGNTAIEQILMNLRLEEAIQRDLNRLVLYCKVASRACHVPIPPSAPLIGSDAFRTGTGVHAAAIAKAEEHGQGYLADRVYSAVPASLFGLRQVIEVGHLSGESNVVYWLRARNIWPRPGLVQAILAYAKQFNRILLEEEIYDVIRTHEIRHLQGGG